ncbi:hypothetical protein GA0111570_10813 [Raineyella antarctica]|uniref:Uncharacterized protein n=1 Tax=Raineyella antarctica TaxID=1577474 RepID=A0A1G6HA32_9ACTN|nr:hypothetical protein [Raineyella antarctica]SDB91004.1 hypothetical protein GA0111570_10813 [Raineyella antarctica]
MSMHLQDWFYLNPWGLWLTAVVLALVIELLQRDRRGLACAGACAVGAVVAALAPGVWWLPVVAALVALGTAWALLRPVHA